MYWARFHYDHFNDLLFFVKPLRLPSALQTDQPHILELDERWVGKHETFSEYDEERLFISHYLHWLSVLQLGNWVFLLSVRYEIVPPKNDFKPYSGQVTLSRVSIS